MMQGKLHSQPSTPYHRAVIADSRPGMDYVLLLFLIFCVLIYICFVFWFCFYIYIQECQKCSQEQQYLIMEKISAGSFSDTEEYDRLRPICTVVYFLIYYCITEIYKY